MVKSRLTDRKLNALRRKATRYDVMDTDVPGFGVRVSEAGLSTFILTARYPGEPSENTPLPAFRKPVRGLGNGRNWSGEELTPRRA
jgi:hypothetical protein